MKKYNANIIENKWQKLWKSYNDGKGIYHFNIENKAKKIYILDMFPYPSGSGLHVGHPKGYTATDVYSRFKKLNGFNVLHPIGWDAFGLPAEQYAIDTKNSPKEFTLKNIEYFKQQLDKLGFCFPENKIVNTTDPNYYQWTQWIFLQMYKKGLAEIKDIEVNWCPNLGTVLSNEEINIDKNGIMVSERGDHPVIRKPMKQWVLKITKYSDKLLKGLEKLDWPESIKESQKNWIGKVEGAEITLFIKESDHKINVFANEVSTLKFASVIVLSINNSDALKYTKNEFQDNVNNYLENCKRQDFSKLSNITNQISGIFTGSYAINPITNKEIPIWVTKSIKNFSSNARIMSPKYSQEELNFLKFTKIQILHLPDEWDFQNELKSNMDFITKKKIGNTKIEYNLHDWIFSRQRYWGEPFPIYFDDKYEKTFPLNENELPLLLPELDKYELNSSDAKGPLSKIHNWIKFNKDGKTYYRDSNTMPQWAGSSWYYIAYLLKQDNGKYLPIDSPKAKNILKDWLPVDLYVGGQEHAVLHLLYARFWHFFLYDLGIVSSPEPFQKLFNQGMILGPNGEKMSKSKGNVINPDEIVSKLGADTLRLYEMFMGPLSSTLKWSNDSLISMHKWLERVFNLFNKDNYITTSNNSNLEPAINKLISSVENNIHELKYNICISDMMVFINACYQEKTLGLEQANKFILILSCFCPHLADELYNLVNKFDDIRFTFLANWPKVDSKYLIKKSSNIVCQVNGKVRATINSPIGISKEQLIEISTKEPNVAKFIENKKINKIIFVPDKLINFVIS